MCNNEWIRVLCVWMIRGTVCVRIFLIEYYECEIDQWVLSVWSGIYVRFRLGRRYWFEIVCKIMSGIWYRFDMWEYVRLYLGYGIVRVICVIAEWILFC